MCLLGPCTIIPKIIIQDIWKEKLAWDDLVPTVIAKRWHNFQETLPILNSILARYAVIPMPVNVTLHGYADASETAYGAAIFIVSKYSDHRIHSNLLCAKARVAPVKRLTLPRLELCAAMILARSMAEMGRSMKVRVNEVRLRTDSTIVLGWIGIAPHLLKTFVANRVWEVQDLTRVQAWGHVRSEDNPADVISRGMSPETLKEHMLWWNGPNWLCKPQTEWPDDKIETF